MMNPPLQQIKVKITKSDINKAGSFGSCTNCLLAVATKRTTGSKMVTMGMEFCVIDDVGYTISPVATLERIYKKNRQVPLAKALGKTFTLTLDQFGN